MAAINDVKKLLRLHRAQLQGVIEKRGVVRLAKTYKQARSELQARLADLARRNAGQTFTAHHLRSMLLQVEDALREFSRRFPEVLSETGALAQSLGAQHTVREVKNLAKTFTGHTPVLQTDRIAVLRGIVDDVKPSLLRRYERSVQLYTVPTVHMMEESMALSLASGETFEDAAARLAATDGVFAQQQWRAERIVRTEMAYSYGITKQRTLNEMRDQDFPKLMKRLVATHDDRTGEDSLELDGQTVPVDEPFIWNKKTKFGVERVEYMQPPNRPNDREVVIPWDPAWGVANREVPVAGAVTPSMPSASLTEKLV